MKGVLPLLNESGMLLVQVIASSAILLAILFAGFKGVETTITIANTTASSAAFKDAILAIEHRLAVTSTCGARIGIPTGGWALNLITAPVDGYPVEIDNSPAIPLAREDNTSNPMDSHDFLFSEVRLKNIRPMGWIGAAIPGGGKQELERYAADLTIVAERRSGFLKSSKMSGTIPLILLVRAGVILNCTKRDLYRVELGPKTGFPAGVTRKIGLECIDRGGMPIQAPDQDWFVCRIPIVNFGVCNTEGAVNAGLNNLPGWWCYRKTDPLGISKDTLVY
jgi:hypothetical protein